MICPECNKENKEDAVVCEFCGAELGGGDNTPEEKAVEFAQTQLDAEVAKGIEDSETENVVGSMAVNADAESEDAVAESEYDEPSDFENESDSFDEVTFDENVYAEPRKVKKGAFIGIAVAAVCVIAAIIIAVTGLVGGGSPTSPVKNIISGLNKSNPDMFFKAYPQAYQTILSDNRMIEFQLGQQVVSQTEEFKENFGDGASIAYNISNKQDVSDEELSNFGSDLSEMFEGMEEMYGEKFGDMSVTDGYVLTVDLNVQGSDKTASETVDVTVLKVNGVWSMNIDDIGVLASVFYQYEN